MGTKDAWPDARTWHTHAVVASGARCADRGRRCCSMIRKNLYLGIVYGAGFLYGVGLRTNVCGS